MASVLKPQMLSASALNIEQMIRSDLPVLIKGLVDNWPLVEKAKNEGIGAALSYLQSLYTGIPVLSFESSEPNARLAYNADCSGYNFSKQKADFGDVLRRLSNGLDTTLYVGSTATDRCFNEFHTKHFLPLGDRNPVQSLWIGNRCSVPTHFDVPSNIACCVLGRRRFTLFPPEQLKNLYVGPMDLTPAGQTVSMVDVNHPDDARYPLFAEAYQQALIVDMEPGDALFIPSMWWHNVEGLDDVNALVNFWWREEPAYLGPPAAVLNHALLSIKHLPKAQRDAWKAHFDHYIFGDCALDYLPENSLGKLGDMDEMLARRLRAELLNQLK